MGDRDGVRSPFLGRAWCLAGLWNYLRGDEMPTEAQKAAGVRFVCGYAGETDYTYKGRKYAVRHWAGDDGKYNGDYYATGIRPLVGCIRSDDSKHWHEFPPAEVLAFFPDMVGARFTADYRVEYMGGSQPPVVVKPDDGYYREQVWSMARVDELAAMFPDDPYYAALKGGA
jgi:hypothetical protein